MRLLVIILLLVNLPAFSQHSSKLGRFAVEYEEGCAPVTVHIIRQDTFGDITLQYEYESGLLETTDTAYTYYTPGVYQIVQYLGEDITPKSDTLTFEVVESPEPDFTIFQCTENQVSIEITDPLYDYFRIKFTNSDSVIYTPGDAPPQFDYGANTGTVSVKGYYANTYPTCAELNTSFNLQPFSATSFNSFTLAEGCIDSLFIQLDGENYNPLYQYRIESSDDQENYSIVYQGQILDNSPFYNIGNQDISDSLCIRITTLNACDQSTVFSEIICQSFDYNLSLSSSFATYSGEQILLKTGTILGTVQVERKSGNSNYADLVEISSDYLDNTPSQFRLSSYRLTRTDTCGYVSEPVEISAPFLSIKDKLFRENIIYLDLEPPANDLGDFDEYLLLYDKDSTETQVLPFESDFRLPPGLGEIIHMRGYYFYPDDSIHVYSNSIVMEYEVKVFVPSAFTPNNDGRNDALELFGLPTEEFEISIYDRWGNVIHQTNVNPVWDGKVDNDRIDEGSYLYRLRFKLETGELKTQVGTFTLLRK
ncbi:MAG: gliding motility-associated C-terminal domain-containing protein [Marinoscillum sp.]